MRVVSVMAVNNEVGTISPLADVVALVRERAPQAVLHTDAVQGFQWLDLPAVVAGCDLVAVSAHKFGGPKGVGALAVGGVAVEPLLMGGGQEHVGAAARQRGRDRGHGRGDERHGGHP